MGKRGPKLQAGIREPNGRISRKEGDFHVYWQRERDALRLMSMKSELESPIGILYRDKRVTDREFAAAMTFLADRRAADAALSLPPRMCQAQDVNAVGGFDGEEGPEEARRKAKCIATYDRAVAALGGHSKEMSAMERVVIYQNWHDDLPMVNALKRALAILVVHYGRRA